MILRVNTFTRIAHAYGHTILRLAQHEFNLSALGGVLEGIGEKVIEHLIHLHCIVPQFERQHVGLIEELKFDFPLHRILPKRYGYLFQHSHNIAVAETHTLNHALLLLEVQQLVNQTVDLLQVILHTVHLAIDRRGHTLLGENRLQLTIDESYGSANLV